MDLNETPTELTTEFEEPNFVKEIAKAFTISTVTSAGVWTGIIAVSVVGIKALEWWERRKKTDENPIVPSETV